MCVQHTILEIVQGFSSQRRFRSLMQNHRRIYIDGSWVEPLSYSLMDVINPATEELCGSVVLASAADVDRAVFAARGAFRTFRHSKREERLDLLLSIFATYVRRQPGLIEALTEELGVPKRFAKGLHVGAGMVQLKAAIAALKRYQFEYASGERTMIRREPIGVVGMITPWNWPINQNLGKILPALATGNTIVHKPSENCPLIAQMIAEIFHEAGVPPGVYNMISGDGHTVGRTISGHPDIDMVSITGSTLAGIDVAKRAAENVKRVHQELGGKSANVILDDADLTRAVTAQVRRCMINSGQTCQAPTRMLVPAEKMEAAKRIARQAVESITCGDPQTDVDMGPVVSKQHWDRIQAFIELGIQQGATLVTGGTGRPEGLKRGFYVRPTIFGDVSNDMVIAREEIFGPVLCILAYSSLEDAILIANDTKYGLGAYVNSSDAVRAAEVAKRLDAGVVYLNEADDDLAAPFGGYKMSGNGREGGAFAFDEFLETKAVIYINTISSTL